MLGFLEKMALPFSVLLGIGVAITIPSFLAIATDDSSSNSKISITVLLAILVSATISIFLMLIYFLIAVGIPKFLKLIMVQVTLKTVKRAVESQTGTVQASGITSIEDDVGVGLLVGAQDGVFPGQKFVVFNSANQEKWGVLEVSEVQEHSCICSVFDRTNPEFWDDLVRRMRRNASPPQGITIRREIPEEALYEWLQGILKSWRK